MLDLAMVLALAAQCAPTVSPPTLAAIAHAESRFDPLAIGVNNGPAVRRARTPTEAAATARLLIAAGRNIDLGLAQINSANLDWLGLSIEAAFDPCRNLAAAATVLIAGYRPSSETPTARQLALRVALSRYNTGHPSRGFRNGYVSRVEASAIRLGLAMPTPLISQLPEADAPFEIAAEAAGEAPAAWDVFARVRLNAVVLFRPEPQSPPWSVAP